MIGVDKILDIIRTAYASAYLKTDKPISLLIIAEPDSGKSQLILSYRMNGAECLTDVTSKGLWEVLKTKENGKPVILVIPDFNAILSHRPAVSGPTLGALLSLLEEGTMKLADPHGVRDMKGQKVSLITAITPVLFAQKVRRWKASGFFRRFIPIHYKYSQETTDKINLSIQNGLYTQEFTVTEIKLPEKKVFVTLPKTIAKEVNEFSKLISERVESRGFTIHKSFRSYVKARALLRQSRTVTKVDLEDLKRAAQFVRIENAEEI